MHWHLRRRGRRRRMRWAVVHLHDAARRRRARGAVERLFQPHFLVHTPAEVLVKGRGVLEHVVHIRDLVDLPAAERPVEGRLPFAGSFNPILAILAFSSFTV